jgi:hypothetical protein
MRIVGPSSEEEMIAVFLRGELGSDRFGPLLEQALVESDFDPRIVTDADISDPDGNDARRKLLDETRGYDRRVGLFAGFPDDVRWQRVALGPDELGLVRFINYDYWIELSGGTRLPADAAARIRAGFDVYGVSSTGFLEAAATLEVGRLPELILVGDGRPDGLVVLEGHVRLAALALRPELVPSELEVLLGTSPGIDEWWAY